MCKHQTSTPLRLRFWFLTRYDTIRFSFMYYRYMTVFGQNLGSLIRERWWCRERLFKKKKRENYGQITMLACSIIYTFKNISFLPELVSGTEEKIKKVIATLYLAILTFILASVSSHFTILTVFLAISDFFPLLILTFLSILNCDEVASALASGVPFRD